MLSAILSYLFWLLFTYLSLCAVYFFVIAVINVCKRKRTFAVAGYKRKIAVLIPAYKEDGIIMETVRAAVTHDYPRDRYDVFVIADAMKPATLTTIEACGAQVIKLALEKSSKARALHTALNQLEATTYAIAMILDADNVMSAGSLEKVNDAFGHGARAVQCHRVAKNCDTPVAMLECINEEINNTLFRSGQCAVGFACAAAGSGMAFDFTLLKTIFNRPGILDDPGEDREVDLQLLRYKIRMEYIHDAWIYDEKVACVQTFRTQRVRWVEAHLNHFIRFFDKDIRSLPKDLHYLNKFFHYLIMPRSFFVLLISSICFIGVGELLVEYTILSPARQWWTVVIGGYLASQLLALPSRFFNTKTLQCLWHIPDVTISMLLNMRKLKLHRKEFIHTPKNSSLRV